MRQTATNNNKKRTAVLVATLVLLCLLVGYCTRKCRPSANEAVEEKIEVPATIVEREQTADNTTQSPLPSENITTYEKLDVNTVQPKEKSTTEIIIEDESPESLEPEPEPGLELELDNSDCLDKDVPIQETDTKDIISPVEIPIQETPETQTYTRSFEKYPQRGFILGISGGTVLGQGTFRSLGSYSKHFGYELSLYGGYRFNNLLTIEATVTIGHQSQTAMDCCQYWLSSTNLSRYFAPVIDERGWYYRDLESRTSWQRYALQLDINLLDLFPHGEDQAWRIELSPRISAFSTLTTLSGPLSDGSGRLEQEYDRQWHLGLGGQLCVSHKISGNIGIGLYIGLDCLGGKRFDRIPVHCHKSNLIYDGGLRLTWLISKKHDYHHE